jgi:hypothetical protein
LADAARRHVTLSEDDIVRLDDECARIAFGPLVNAMRARDGREPLEDAS